MYTMYTIHGRFVKKLKRQGRVFEILEKNFESKMFLNFKLRLVEQTKVRPPKESSTTHVLK